MLRMELGNRPIQNCDGIARRHALRLGATSLLGGLSLPTLLELQAKAGNGREIKAKSCVFLFLEGGPPHQDMWDPKPDAPEEIRGPFMPIATNVPGTFVTQARATDCFRRCFFLFSAHTHKELLAGSHWHEQLVLVCQETSKDNYLPYSFWKFQSKIHRKAAASGRLGWDGKRSFSGGPGSAGGWGRLSVDRHQHHA